jgi:hypothetical protein
VRWTRLVTAPIAASLAAVLVTGPGVSASPRQDDPISPVVAPACEAPGNLTQVVLTLSLLSGVPTEDLMALFGPLYQACSSFPYSTERTTCGSDRRGPLTSPPVITEGMECITDNWSDQLNVPEVG